VAGIYRCCGSCEIAGDGQGLDRSWVAGKQHRCNKKDYQNFLQEGFQSILCVKVILLIRIIASLIKRRKLFMPER